MCYINDDVYGAFNNLLLDHTKDPVTAAAGCPRPRALGGGRRQGERHKRGGHRAPHTHGEEEQEEEEDGDTAPDAALYPLTVV